MINLHYPHKLPDNFRIIDEEAFSRSNFFVTVLKRVGFAQGTVNGKAYDWYLYYLNCDGTPDEGFAIARDYWEKKVVYARFGCDHQWRGVTQQECHERNILHMGRCYTVRECTLCGKIEGIDSSD